MKKSRRATIDLAKLKVKTAPPGRRHKGKFDFKPAEAKVAEHVAEDLLKMLDEEPTVEQRRKPM